MLCAMPVNISGILVVVRASELQSVVTRLGELDGVDVHHVDPASGRVVATIEAETTAGEIGILERIKRLPAVILAEMVEHHVDVENTHGKTETNPESGGDGR